MTKFRVSVEGKNYEIVILKRRFPFRKIRVRKPVGFLTTRFVEAETANDAVENVFALLKAELDKDGRITENSVMELEGIREDEEGFDRYAPGGGYTFSSESED